MTIDGWLFAFFLSSGVFLCASGVRVRIHSMQSVRSAVLRCVALRSVQLHCVVHRVRGAGVFRDALLVFPFRWPWC